MQLAYTSNCFQYLAVKSRYERFIGDTVAVRQDGSRAAADESVFINNEVDNFGRVVRMWR